MQTEPQFHHLLNGYAKRSPLKMVIMKTKLDLEYNKHPGNGIYNIVGTLLGSPTLKYDPLEEGRDGFIFFSVSRH